LYILVHNITTFSSWRWWWKKFATDSLWNCLW